MRDGFVKVAALTPGLRVADVRYNTDECIKAARRAVLADGASVVLLPELALSGYTCEDLFWQDMLLDSAERSLERFCHETAELDAILIVGVPLRVNAKLYNCAAVINKGALLGVVPKLHIPTYNEFYEGRHFMPGPSECAFISCAGSAEVPFGTKQLFACESVQGLVVAVELCEDLWTPAPPSDAHALAGATLICNLSASNELVGKADYRRDLVKMQSARLISAYMYASAGWGESSQDLVFSGHNLIAENGRMLAESAPFEEAYAVSEIDVTLLAAERRRMSSFAVAADPALAGYCVSYFKLELRDLALTRNFDPHPFVPLDAARRTERCEEVFAIQSHGLAKRILHTNSATAVLGISGGLDSTLALLVTVRAFDLTQRDRSGIVAVTMPGFGTTDRTYTNALRLARALGVDLREISIVPAVRQHFTDIGHDECVHDVTYENSQARERTQILMDIANQTGGFVVGTGDLSELALGWATYNGDHMSMYGVNSGVPKTLVRHLVRYVADSCGDAEVADVLSDVLATPVSPELLPASSDGSIAQKTEDLVGPYELHDFFLYEVLRRGSAPAKVLRLACLAFAGVYERECILAWLKVFYRRFFSQQFKRSCLPDGPKVGSVAVSPRGDLRMPSDALSTLWLSELEEL